MTVPVSFTKCFYKENCIDLFDKNSKFTKLSQKDENFCIYEYSFLDYAKYNICENNNVYSKFLCSKIYLLDKSYIFISTEYETQVKDEDITFLGNTVFRICHGANNLNFPEREIVQEIFNNLKASDKISFLQPDGYSVKRIEYGSDDFEDYCLKSKMRRDDSTETFSFIFYYYQILKNLDSLNEDIVKGLKNAVFGNSSSFKITAEINEIKLNDCYSIYAAKTGIGLLKIAKDDIKSDIVQIIFQKYLEALKEIIHYEIKAKNFNKELDIGEYKNIDLLNTAVRKEMRNAVHLKYDIKNSISTNSIRKIFFGKFLSAIGFNETLLEFIEICHSMENELHAKIEEREEEHDKHFDKILSVVAVFAIVSVFKDGSDLIISFLEALLNKNQQSFTPSEIVNLLAPFCCLIVLLILIKIFNKKK